MYLTVLLVSHRRCTLQTHRLHEMLSEYPGQILDITYYEVVECRFSLIISSQVKRTFRQARTFIIWVLQ